MGEITLILAACGGGEPIQLATQKPMISLNLIASFNHPSYPGILEIDMKKLLSAIAIGSGLLSTTACFAYKANTSSNRQQSPATDLAMAQGHSGHGGGHEGMSMPAATATTMAQLTAGKIQAGAPAKLMIEIKNESGQPIDQFETFQTKLMHLIVVSDDLQTFSHIHPVYKQQGRFEVEANFPQGGNYTLVSDYKPAGQAEQVSLMSVKVAGSPVVTPQPNFVKAKTIGDTKVQLTAEDLKAGQEAMLVFKIQQDNGQPVTDLQPYLGERGHLVIMRHSVPLQRADYIHAHAAHGGGGEVHFMATFPRPGKYKLWGQFNRGGKIVTADFWVNVS
jgi:hypothetical protein